MPDPLASRLRQLRAALRLRGEPQEPAGGGAGASEAAPEDRFAGWERVGELTYRRILRFESPLARAEVSPLLLPRELALRDMVFFDTETTGLSGGAGTLIFLIGLGRIDGSSLEVEQVFLADFPGEPEFLEWIRPVLESARLFVSYNGRAFDAPILRTRFLLNRMSLELERHNDLLFWARRLWRRLLASCSLASIEREVLGVMRERDVPGYEVPGIYLDFLRRGWSPNLPLVWEHNLQDVRTMAVLFARVNDIVTGREPPARMDLASLGSYLLASGHERGVRLLERAFVEGDEAAGRALGLHHKRAGRWAEAAEVWRRQAERRESLFAAVELAKYCEHRLHDPRAALEWVLKLRSWNLPLSFADRRELAARQARLERKLKAL